MAFTSRHPFTTDAFSLGYAPGVREDYTLQQEDLANVDTPVVFLDNDYEDPDLDRYLEAFEQFDPSVAVIGDSYNRLEAERYVETVEELRRSWPEKRYIVAPKSRDSFPVLSGRLTLGYANGFSNLSVEDFSDLQDWRGEQVHILGGNPQDQFEVYQELTQPTVTGLKESDVVGVDYNGFLKAAYFGEAWTRDGYQSAEHLSVRESVKQSLQETKAYWQDKELWPDTEPLELYGPAVREPAEPVFRMSGEPVTEREELEEAYPVEIEGETHVFRSESRRDFYTWRRPYS